MGSDDRSPRGDGGGDRRAMEQRLLRAAREFEKQQEEKLVTQHDCIGQPLMTPEEIQAIVEEQERRRASEERQQREQDRDRDTTEKEDVRVVVALPAHPLRQREAAAPLFRVSAADRLAARRALLETFVTAARAKLTIHRVQTRLNAARTALQGERQAGAGMAVGATPALSVFTFPAAPTSAPPVVGAVEVALGEEDAPTTAVDSFQPVELKVPLHFQQMGYRPLPWPEHPFVSADPPAPVPLFPFGDNEPTAEERQALPEALVISPAPKTTVSMTHEWPTQPFTFPAYARTDLFPYDVRLPEDALGFAAPFFAYDFGEGDLPAATTWQHVCNGVLHEPLPAPLMAGRAEDELSDTDDEDAPAVELGVRPPAGLADVAAAFAGLEGSFLLMNPELVASALPEKPIHRADRATRNPLRVAEVERLYADVEGCLPTSLRKQF